MVRTKNNGVGCRGFTGVEMLRLEQSAQLFGLTFTANPDGTHTLVVLDCGGQRTATVSSSLAHYRLLAEVCEKIIPWVYFSTREHCAKTFFSLSDNKVHRLGQLYSQAVHRAAT